MNFSTLLGTGGGNTGMNYTATGVPLQSPTNSQQILDAYNSGQSGINQQQSFVNALNAQNGLYNQNNVYGQQQALSDTLGGIANGTGPNPAQAMLAQSTGNNVANQAALMAGQRGSNANVGMMARQAAMQGANIQQQSAGQAAALQAQQSLNALSGQAAQQQAMQNVAGSQVGQQSQGLTNLNQAQQNEQNMLMNAANNYGGQQVAMQSNINNANAGIQNTVAQGQQSLQGGLLGGIGTALLRAHGGMIPNHYSNGGQVANGPQSMAGKFLNGYSSGSGMNNSPSAGIFNGGMQFGQGLGQAISNGFSNLFSPSPTSIMQNNMPSFNSLNPSTIGEQNSSDSSFNKGGKVMKGGGKVPGKDKVKGDSYANDTVNAKLSPGEIVIPVSITQGKDPITEGARFIAATLAKHYGSASGLKNA